MLRTAFMILFVRIGIAVLTFGRNLIIARMISVEDFGIASTFAIVMVVIEMTTDIGLRLQIVQAKDGDDPRLQAGLQGFQLLRGVIAGIVLLFLAHPFALFLNVPEATWAYRVMAVVPVLNALIHFDVYRKTRAMRFGPSLLTSALSVFLAVATLWPLSLWFGDWRVMLYSLIIQSALMAIISHLMATRPYRLVLDRQIMVRGLSFGWPLLANAILMMAGFYGDRLIVGRELGMIVLAIFSMGIILTLRPSLVISGSVHSFFLPQLSAAQTDRKRFTHLSMVMMEAVLLISIFMVLIFVIIGGPLIDLLLGSKYAELLPYLTWLAIMQAFRTFKQGPSTIAMAVEETKNAMISNIVRTLFLPLCWYAAVTSGDLLMIIWILTAGEAAAYAMALIQLRTRRIVTLRPAILPHIAAGIFILAASLFTIFLPPAHPEGFSSPIVILILIVLTGLSFWTMRDLREYITNRKQKRSIGWD